MTDFVHALLRPGKQLGRPQASALAHAFLLMSSRLRQNVRERAAAQLAYDASTRSHPDGHEAKGVCRLADAIKEDGQVVVVVQAGNVHLRGCQGQPPCQRKWPAEQRKAQVTVKDAVIGVGC